MPEYREGSGGESRGFALRGFLWLPTLQPRPGLELRAPANHLSGVAAPSYRSALHSLRPPRRGRSWEADLLLPALQSQPALTEAPENPHCHDLPHRYCLPHH